MTASPGTATDSTELHPAPTACSCGAEADAEALLTIRTAATRLSVTYRHCRRLIADGRIEGTIIARNRSGLPVWRISASELARFEATRKSAKDAA
jgi:excisionase family DNA binding protein